MPSAEDHHQRNLKETLVALEVTTRIFFCLAGPTAAELRGRQAGMGCNPGSYILLLGPAESFHARKVG